MKSKQKNTFIVGIVSFVFVASLIIFFMFFHQRMKKTLVPEHSLPKESNNNLSPKKILASQIQADLKKDLEEAKKKEKSKSGFGGCSWIIGRGEICSEYRGNDQRLSYFGSLETDSGKKYKERIRYEGEGICVFPEELETSDWKEIEGLIKQIKDLEEKKKPQKTQEEKTKINQELKSNPKMFFYEGVWEWWDNDPRNYEKGHHVFRGIESNQEFYLVFPKNHPAIASLPKHKEFPNEKQSQILVLIEEIKDITLQSNGKVDFWKKVKLTDKITITSYNFSV